MSRLLWADKSRDLVVYCRAERMRHYCKPRAERRKGHHVARGSFESAAIPDVSGCAAFACVLGLFRLLRPELRLRRRALRLDVFGGFAFADRGTVAVR